MVFSASGFPASDGLLGFLSLLCSFGGWGMRGFFLFPNTALLDLLHRQLTYSDSGKGGRYVYGAY
jgi:hypothetical protein